MSARERTLSTVDGGGVNVQLTSAATIDGCGQVRIASAEFSVQVRRPMTEQAGGLTGLYEVGTETRGEHL